MGPLVPEMISPEVSLLLAVVLGFGFGFALEQAGFSSTHKLVGLFYGYDFTVLRVFFTAGITAMLGVLVLGHLGWLDLDLIFVNPFFVRSALVGGLVMGAGFVIGGFCPGTSICAATIGKIDALIFIGGAVIGVGIFAGAYPALEQFYQADELGALRVDAYLGLAPELFAALLIAVALVAFLVTTLLENRVNGRRLELTRELKIRVGVLAALPLVVVGVVAATPDHREAVLARIEEAEQQRKCVFREIGADKLAYDLTHHHFELNLIDVRDSESYAKGHLPLAINIPLDQILSREWEQIFEQQQRRNVFYADDELSPKKACLLAKHVGDSENYVLREPYTTFRRQFFEIAPPGSGASKAELETYAFRSEAAREMRELAATLGQLKKPKKKKLRKIKGGCS